MRADHYNWCVVPDKGYDAVLFGAMAVVVAVVLQGKFSALWTLVAGLSVANYHLICDQLQFEPFNCSTKANACTQKYLVHTISAQISFRLNSCLPEWCTKSGAFAQTMLMQVAFCKP